MQVTTEGDYFIKVEAYFGSSKYVLNIGSTSLKPTATAAGTPANFVPDEVIVKYKPQSVGATISALTQTPGIHLSHYDHSRPALLKRDRNTDNATIMSALGVSIANASPARQAFEATLPDESRRKLETLRLIKQLNANARCRIRRTQFYPAAAVHPERSLLPVPAALPADPPAAGLGHHHRRSSVIVAVVDTGVFLAHQDLLGQLVSGYDFISDKDNANDSTMAATEHQW